jgi:hypothetical protein
MAGYIGAQPLTKAVSMYNKLVEEFSGEEV